MLFLKQKLVKGISPFLVLSLPYLLLVNVNNFVMVNIYNYLPISELALVYTLLFLAIIFLIEIIVSLSFKRIKVTRVSLVFKRKNYNIVVFLFYIGLIAYILSFVLRVMQYGLNGIKGMNNGLLGHISFLFKIISPLYLDYKIEKKQIKRGIFFIALGIMISLLFGGKYGIFVNILYIIVYYLLKEKRNTKKVLTIFAVFGLTGFLVFLFLYAVIPMLTHSYGSYATMQTSVDFAIEHFFSYLCHPLIASNYAFTNIDSNSSLVPFTVVINIFKALTGNKDYVDPIYDFVFPATVEKNTNVAGLFGELHYCLGPLSLLFVFCTFIVIEIFWQLYKRKRMYFLTNCFLLSIVSLMFFCNFFTVSGMVLPLIYLFVIETFLQATPRKKTGNIFNDSSLKKSIILPIKDKA